jgi:hypothetical protein
MSDGGPDAISRVGTAIHGLTESAAHPDLELGSGERAVATPWTHRTDHRSSTPPLQQRKDLPLFCIRRRFTSFRHQAISHMPRVNTRGKERLSASCRWLPMSSPSKSNLVFQHDRPSWVAKCSPQVIDTSVLLPRHRLHAFRSKCRRGSCFASRPVP